MFCSPFTAAQWQELENQALIFKHFLAGVPVPPSLLLSVRRSLGSSPACFYTNPTLSYYSYFGKKFDPEPGRCRRTDGKKWRCARDAYPDSKYCERHMHRGKTRSRKPVESQTLPQLQSSSSSSTVTTSFTPSGSTNRCFQNDSLQFSITGGCSDHSSKLDNKDYSYLNRAKADVDIHTFIPEASGKSKGFVNDSSVDTSVLAYPQLQKSSYIGNEFDFLQPMEQESSSVRPFFDEWPKPRDAWADFEDERWNQTSLSNTQLSISIPMPSSDFPTLSSRFSIDD